MFVSMLPYFLYALAQRPMNAVFPKVAGNAPSRAMEQFR